MESSASIWDRARVDLVLTTEDGEPDTFLWEHSRRIAQSAVQISTLPEIKADHPDPAAVVAAALYHDAGWVVRVQDGSAKRIDILGRPAPDTHRDQSAWLLEKRLGSILEPRSMELALAAVRTLNDRDIPGIEGRIVTEAENLDEFGVLSLWSAIRRGALEGKGVTAVLETWRRRQEYHFWAARLSDSFRFDAVRQIARQRLNQLEDVMTQIDQQHAGADVQVGKAAPKSESTRIQTS
jgi:hypothetical protein